MSGGDRNNVIRWAATHHRMAVWDDNPACCSCIRKTGQVCSRSNPCGVCHTWSEALWTKVQQVEIRSAKRRLDRAELHLSGVKGQSGIVQLLTPRISDKAVVVVVSNQGSMGEHSCIQDSAAYNCVLHCKLSRWGQGSTQWG